MLVTLAAVSLGFALLSATLFIRNLMLYRAPAAVRADAAPKISVLIPARNEEQVIREAVTAALASRGVELEVIVLDDHSEDGTARIVAELSKRNGRVRLEHAPPLPPGWCGKQFACSVLAQLAAFDTLCFVDSDVRLKPDGLARMGGYLRRSGCGLVSGFPHQELETFFEKLLLPMMHFLLLSYLPIDFMRRFVATSLGAGCGQLFVADREAYRKAGGHAAIRRSRHDGIALPRAFRRAGILTDICDATEIADCRMYRSAREVFNGLLKNANEGMASPIRIVVFTGLLGLGHVLPLVLVLICLLTLQRGLPLDLSLGAMALSLLPRLLAAARFRQPVVEALLHPLGTTVLLGLQWYALGREVAGVPAVWKGRSYQPT